MGKPTSGTTTLSAHSVIVKRSGKAVALNSCGAATHTIRWIPSVVNGYANLFG